MVDYEGAIKRPFSDLKKLAIGGILNIIPIANFIATGYALKAAKMKMGKKDGLPEWEDWGELFMKGLSVVVIGLIYMIPALVLMGVGMGSAIMGALQGTVSPEVIMSAGGVIILAAIVLLFTAYIMPSAIMKYLKDYQFGDAFQIGEVIKKAFTMNYFIATVIVFVYSMILSTIFSFVPIIGVGFSGFIIGITALTIYVEVFEEMKK